MSDADDMPSDFARMRSVVAELRDQLHLLMLEADPWTTEEVARRFERFRELRDLAQLSLDMTSHYVRRGQ